jgi:hypothetical protein
MSLVLEKKFTAVLFLSVEDSRLSITRKAGAATETIQIIENYEVHQFTKEVLIGLESGTPIKTQFASYSKANNTLGISTLNCIGNEKVTLSGEEFFRFLKTLMECLPHTLAFSCSTLQISYLRGFSLFLHKRVTIEKAQSFFDHFEQEQEILDQFLTTLPLDKRENVAKFIYFHFNTLKTLFVLRQIMSTYK